MHLNDRLSARGGADWHLLSVIEAQHPEHTVMLAAGFDDHTASTPCSRREIRGLAERTAAPCDALAELVSSFRPDVIHVHNVMNPTALRWAADHDAVMTVQDHRSFCPSRGKWTRSGEVCDQPMDRETCAACFDDPGYAREIFDLTEARLSAIRGMRLVVLSSYMQDKLQELGATDVRVIPPFVAGLNPDAAPSGPPCVLFAGRLVQPKGVDHAVAAWRASGVELPLVFAGTGRMRAGLIDKGFEVLGWVPHGDLSAVYRRAQVLVLPSLWQEPFGIVGLEAATLGVPVAAYDSGGVRDWHPGPGLVPWGDVEALGAAIAQLRGAPSPPVAGFEAAPLMRRLYDRYER